ncbi:MAG: hypothetical protein DRN05_05535 [Thermoplasmata archaeon]|nr:MAG: hypothetical protein DRN05_05535 [Thermoplasmata archaeon]
MRFFRKNGDRQSISYSQKKTDSVFLDKKQGSKNGIGKRIRIGLKRDESKDIIEKKKRDAFFDKKSDKKDGEQLSSKLDDNVVFHSDKKEEKEDVDNDDDVVENSRVCGKKEGGEEEDVFTDFTTVTTSSLLEKENVANMVSTARKKKPFLQKDMRGKPVYLEDTGEKLGTVFDMIYDGEKNLIGYKIKDEKSDTVLSFPIDQFEEDKNGLIFIPGWYTKAVKAIERFEFKDRISPEITTLLTDSTISNEELYNIFVRYDDEMAKYMEEAAALREMLNNRLKVLEKQRLALKESLMDLTEKRLIKDIDRKQFSENVMEHRRKVNVLDVNIKKCKELLERLDQTSFGKLGRDILAKKIGEKHASGLYKKTSENGDAPSLEKNNLAFTDDIEIPYKEKYYELKQRYEQLQENYNDLKSAVEKLLTRDMI